MTVSDDRNEYAAAAAQPQGETVKIFGREPAFWIGVVEAVLAVALSWNGLGFHLSSERVALIMAVVTGLFGVYTAYVTHDTMLGVGVGLAKAVVALAAGYSVALTADQTSAAIALVTILLGAYNRTQTVPLTVGSFREAPAVG